MIKQNTPQANVANFYSLILASCATIYTLHFYIFSTMSYKHNNLMAMRQNYWNDVASPAVTSEKHYFQQILIEHGIFESASLEDAKYFFFSLPSIIIVKGYALGFMDNAVKIMLSKYIDAHKQDLIHRQEIKIQFRM